MQQRGEMWIEIDRGRTLKWVFCFSCWARRNLVLKGYGKREWRKLGTFEEKMGIWGGNIGEKDRERRGNM